MDINNRIFETGLPEQPLKPQTPHEKAKKEAVPSIFDVDNDGLLSLDEQRKYLKKNISRKNYKYLTKKDYNKIIEDFTSFGEMKVNEYIEQKMESLKGRIEKKLSDKNGEKQFFGLAETVPNHEGTTSKIDIVEKIRKLINTKEYENLDEDEIEVIISDAVPRSYPTEEFTDDLLRIFTNQALDRLKRANDDSYTKEFLIKAANKSTEEVVKEAKERQKQEDELVSDLLKDFGYIIMFLSLSGTNSERVKDAYKLIKVLDDADLNQEQKEEYRQLKEMFFSKYPNPKPSAQ